MAKNNNSHGLSEKTSDIILVVITAVVLLLVAYPLYYVLVASFSNPYDVYAGKTFLLPSQFTLDGYKAVFADPNILTGYGNSIKYTVIGTIFSVTLLYISAYPLAQKDLPGRKFFSVFFIITMYFGGGLIPTYLVVKQTGLVNNMWALFLPGGVGVGNMIIVRNYFQNSIPHELMGEYYRDVANMEPRAVERLTDLYEFWIPQVASDTVYPGDCTFTLDELEVIDRYKADFESAVSEQEGLWIKNGGPTDEEWESYKAMLENNCGMSQLLEVYQAAYDRFAANEG